MCDHKRLPLQPVAAPCELTGALNMDRMDAAIETARAASFAPPRGVLCHTPQPIPPVDDDDDDEDDDDDRGSGGGNIDPDDDDGWPDEDDEDEDDTLWTGGGGGWRRVPLIKRGSG